MNRRLKRDRSCGRNSSRFKFAVILAIAAALSLLPLVLSACNYEDDSYTAEGAEGIVYSGKITLNGESLTGASVFVNGAEADKSNENGLFLLYDLIAGDEISFGLDGYSFSPETVTVGDSNVYDLNIHARAKENPSDPGGEGGAEPPDVDPDNSGGDTPGGNNDPNTPSTPGTDDPEPGGNDSDPPSDNTGGDDTPDDPADVPGSDDNVPDTPDENVKDALLKPENVSFITKDGRIYLIFAPDNDTKTLSLSATLSDIAGATINHDSEILSVSVSDISAAGFRHEPSGICLYRIQEININDLSYTEFAADVTSLFETKGGYIFSVICSADGMASADATSPVYNYYPNDPK